MVPPAIQWDKTIGTTKSENLAYTQQTTYGGYILGGTTTKQNSFGLDYWLVKLSANGTKQWDKTFGGSNYDQLEDVSQTSDGGYVLGGSSLSSASGEKSEESRGASDYWIIKVSASGTKEWDKTLGGANYDSFHCVKQLANGGYIVGGGSVSAKSGDKTESNKGNSEFGDFWIVALSSEGKQIWDKTIGGNLEERFSNIQQTNDGGFIVSGSSGSNAGFDK